MHAQIIGIVAALVLVAGPLALGMAGWRRVRRDTDSVAQGRAAWDWKLSVVSALLYTLAFNLTFFLQELFLVLPKALTPGLYPTLYHNNHAWDGENPLAGLFQGTGALAILISGLVCAMLLRRRVLRATAGRLWLIWMAYCGIFMALPQLVIGALSGGSDVGMAMDTLHFGATTKTACALIALVAMPPAALWLRAPLLNLADSAAETANAAARNRYIFRLATLPALLAIVLIVPFRMPREAVEVVMVPVVVTVVGLLWIQSGAWCARTARAEGGLRRVSIAWLLATVLALLLVFQLMLRPGIRFY